MPPTPACSLLKETYRSLLSLQEAFQAELKAAAKTGDFRTLESLRQEIIRHQAIIEGNLVPFEQELKLKEQYESQKTLLESNALLEQREGILGIEGIDGTFYAFPTLREISRRLREQQELLKTKIGQGFGKLRIEPFALPVQKKIDAYQSALERHFRTKTLFARGTKELPFSDKKKTLQPMFVWSQYVGADQNGTLVYHPKVFAKTGHQGRTKQELLAQPMTFPGFRVFFAENDPVIPRAGQAKTLGGRPQIEAAQSPEAYRALLKQDAYRGETLLTIDDWFIHALTHLEGTNEVIDDYGNGEDSACYCPESFFPGEGASGRVSGACWDRGFAQACLGGSVPGGRGSADGGRSAVMV